MLTHSALTNVFIGMDFISWQGGIVNPAQQGGSGNAWQQRVQGCQCINGQAQQMPFGLPSGGAANPMQMMQAVMQMMQAAMPGIAMPTQQAGFPMQPQQSGFPMQPQQSGFPMQPQQSGFPMQPQQSGGFPTGGGVNPMQMMQSAMQMMQAAMPGIALPMQQSGFPMQPQQSGFPMGAQQAGFPMQPQQSGSPMGPQQAGFPMQMTCNCNNGMPQYAMNGTVSMNLGKLRHPSVVPSLVPIGCSALPHSVGAHRARWIRRRRLGVPDLAVHLGHTEDHRRGLGGTPPRYIAHTHAEHRYAITRQTDSARLDSLAAL